MLYTNELDQELLFKTSRSSGPGGQNVNKVESRVELYWNVLDSSIITDLEKSRIVEKLGNRINKSGELVMSAQTERSQRRNKEELVKRFYTLLNAALVKPKNRKATRPTQASKQKRIDNKKRNAQNKKLRQRPNFD